MGGGGRGFVGVAWGGGVRMRGQGSGCPLGMAAFARFLFTFGEHLNFNLMLLCIP